MRRALWIALIGMAIDQASAGLARAQVFVGAGGPAPIAPYYAAPGNYGMSYGVPSFGSVRTYSAFSSPFGPGYGYGYPPYAFVPGAYGAGLWGLWRPGFGTAEGYSYGGSYYSTFAAPYRPWAGFNPVPVGVYAPGFGPTFYPTYNR